MGSPEPVSEHDTGHIRRVKGCIFTGVTDPLGQKHKHFYLKKSLIIERRNSEAI